MATARVRRDCAQLLLRMEPAERARIREGIPHGELNRIAVQLLMEYAEQQAQERQSLPLEDSAA